MATLTENDLKELKDFITEQFQEVSRQFVQTNTRIDQLSQEIDKKIETLSKDMNEKIETLSKDMDKKLETLSKDMNEKIETLSKEMDKKLETLSKEINGKIDKLSEEVTSLRVDFASLQGEFTGINKRLDNLDFTNRTIFVAIITALMTGIIKLFFPNNP